jgi:hypothetical protein
MLAVTIVLIVASMLLYGVIMAAIPDPADRKNDENGQGNDRESGK